MYELIKSLKGPHIGVHIKADIKDREHRELVNLVEERFRQFGAVRLMVLYTADPGMIGAETLYDNLRFAKLSAGKLAKMAVVGNRAQENTWIGLFGLFGGIQTNYFSSNESEAAVAWLDE